MPQQKLVECYSCGIKERGDDSQLPGLPKGWILKWGRNMCLTCQGRKKIPKATNGVE